MFSYSAKNDIERVPAPKSIVLKVVILGDSGVGKTSVISQYVDKRFSIRQRATVGTDFFTKKVQVDKKVITLQIWDTAGQERFQSLGTWYYRGADCCILTFDVTNMDTFVSLDFWRKEFLTQGAPNDPENYPFIVLGNKADLENRVVSSRMVQKWCESMNNTLYFESSAKDGTNLEEAFYVIAKNCVIQETLAAFFEPPQQIKLIAEEPEPVPWNACSC